MFSSLKKFILIIVLILLLPLIIYTYIQLNNISEDEKFLEKIYAEQLNTIIFSVNQYTEDSFQSWIKNINNIVLNDSLYLEDKMSEFCKANPSISLIIISDSLNSANMEFYASNKIEKSQNAVIKMQKILNDNAETLNSLKDFKNLGYTKVQPLKNTLDNTPLLSFIISNNKNKSATLVLNTKRFINDILMKKINSISTKDFIISIFHDKSLVSYTGGTNVSFDKLIEYKELWNLPNYYLGISTPGSTIKDLVEERTFTNLIILIFLNVLILLGVFFLFVTIRKEIKLSQLKSDFVSNVSHEIRTPLSLIGMFAETLELNRVDSEEQKIEYYKIIRKETERLTRIVNSILNFSKMESNNKKYNFKNENLNLILDEVLNTYQHELNGTKNKCKVNKFENLPDISIDKESVMEAIFNLIDNAIKYCENNCVIEISTGMNNDAIYLEISDNGIGISKENQKKIFDKFFRVTTGNVHNTKGSGLGLTLVKNIMEAHNGNVIVESKLGAGSKFKLIFPKING
ncbi:MAG: HAMP domain-containing histidine kinase [Ignavibacteriales bacterium]|nr:HAMP domain-containing histidine kinase [Ignavibacteriales bacterium]